MRGGGLNGNNSGNSGGVNFQQGMGDFSSLAGQGAHNSGAPFMANQSNITGAQQR